MAEDIIARIKDKIMAEKLTSEINNNSKEEVNAEDDTLGSPETDMTTDSYHTPFIETMIRDQLDPKPDQYVMSHQELISEIITIITLGFDTSKTANATVLCMLALHPDIQQDVSLMQKLKLVTKRLVKLHSGT